MNFEELKYIYTGTDNFEEDKKFYEEILSLKKNWEFHRFGAKVSSYQFQGTETQIVLADHHKAGYRRLIYRVVDLEKSISELIEKGLVFDSNSFGIPDGICINFSDKSGNLYAIYEKKQPDSYLIEEFLRQQSEKN